MVAPASFQERLGRRLRGVRVRMRLTLDEVEELSQGEYRAASVSAYERGDRAISMARLAELADFYGAPIEYLVTGRLRHELDSATTLFDIDLDRLGRLPDGDLGPIRDHLPKMRLAEDGTGREVIRLGLGGLRLLASLYEIPVAELILRLTEWGAIIKTERLVPEAALPTEVAAPVSAAEISAEATSRSVARSTVLIHPPMVAQAPIVAPQPVAPPQPLAPQPTTPLRPSVPRQRASVM